MKTLLAKSTLVAAALTVSMISSQAMAGDSVVLMNAASPTKVVKTVTTTTKTKQVVKTKTVSAKQNKAKQARIKFKKHSKSINVKQRSANKKLAQAQRTGCITTGETKRMQDFLARIDQREANAKKDRVLTANERKKLHGMLDNAHKRLDVYLAR